MDWTKSIVWIIIFILTGALACPHNPTRRNILANIKSSIKRARQNVKRRVHNRYYKTTTRTYLKRARAQVTANDLDNAQTTIQQAIKLLDKAAQKRLIHPNTAARKKSRLVKALNKAKATPA
jgi:small subunit ribosomal protein S20